MTQTLLAVDTRDDRRELVVLLDKLPPRKRVRFVEWCCETVTRPRQSAPVAMVDPQMLRDAMRCDRGDTRLTNECLTMLYGLGAQWNLDMPRAAAVLESYVRSGNLPPPQVQTPKAVRPRFRLAPA